MRSARTPAPAGVYLTADPVAFVGRPSDGDALRRGSRAPRPARRDRAARPLAGRAAVPRRPRRLPRLRVRCRCWSRACSPCEDDQRLPLLRFGLHDWAIAWNARTGRGVARRAGRRRRRRRRSTDAFDDVRERLAEWAFGRRPWFETRDIGPELPLEMRSNIDRASYLETGRAASGRRSRDGELYQANLTRRLETPLQRRSVAALPTPAGGQPGAVRGVPRPGLHRRRAARDPVGLAGGVPRGRCRRPRHDRSDQGHASARPRPGRAIADSRASSSAVPRTVPRT